MNISALLSGAAGAAAGTAIFFLSVKSVSRLAANRELPVYRCRCGKPAAVFAACAGAASAVFAGSAADTVCMLAMLYLLMTVSLTDLEYRIIPNSLVLSVFLLTALRGAAALLSVSVVPGFSLKDSAAGGAAMLFLFSLPALFGRKAGCGDIKLGCALGFALGLKGGLACSVIMGLAVLVYAFASRAGRQLSGAAGIAESLKEKIPLGPALSASAMCVLTVSRAAPGLFS